MQIWLSPERREESWGGARGGRRGAAGGPERRHSHGLGQGQHGDGAGGRQEAGGQALEEPLTREGPRDASAHVSFGLGPVGAQGQRLTPSSQPKNVLSLGFGLGAELLGCDAHLRRQRTAAGEARPSAGPEDGEIRGFTRRLGTPRVHLGNVSPSLTPLGGFSFPQFSPVFLASVWRAGRSAGPVSWAVTCSSSWLTSAERAAGLPRRLWHPPRHGGTQRRVPPSPVPEAAGPAGPRAGIPTCPATAADTETRCRSTACATFSAVRTGPPPSPATGKPRETDPPGTQRRGASRPQRGELSPRHQLHGACPTVSS